MHRASTFFCIFIVLILSSTALADENNLLARLENHDSYSLQIEGRDEDGEFTATYLYTPDLQVLKRRDRKGESTYLYDKLKRPEKVMVTRSGVAYLYRLDNPNLPDYFPGSLLQYYLGLDSQGGLSFRYLPDGSLDSLEVGDYSSEGPGFMVPEVEFDPDLENSRFRRYASYLRQ